MTEQSNPPTPLPPPTAANYVVLTITFHLRTKISKAKTNMKNTFHDKKRKIHHSPKLIPPATVLTF